MTEGLKDTVAKGFGEAIVGLIDRIFDAATVKYSSARDVAKVKWRIGFESYLSEAQEHCRRTKTLINRYDPVELSNMYIPLQFKIGRNVFEQLAVENMILDGRQLVITGMAGCGKSLTLKKIFNDLIESGEYIPVYLELRRLTSYKGGLRECLCSEISRHVGEFSETALMYGLKKGLFVLVLDGFDEIPRSKQRAIEAEIHEIIASAPTARLVISGRPSAIYHSWHSVVEAQVQELTQDRVVQLIAKTDFDEDTKNSFSESVKQRLFKTHRKLLSNPLLCTLMLMTYDEFSDIPERIHVYYRKAFEVLVRKHDALKPQYTREFCTNIGDENFQRVFESFCYLGFVEGRTNFLNEDMYRLVKEALEYEGVEANESDYIEDLVSNVCVMFREGDFYTFIHRSFQEYFCASFLVGRSHQNLKDLINGISETFLEAGVLNLMVEMNREVLERSYLIPALEILLKYAEDAENEVTFLKEVLRGILVVKDKKCVPVFDVANEQDWLAPGMYAVGHIANCKLSYPALPQAVWDNVSKSATVGNIAGAPGFFMKPVHAGMFDVLVKHCNGQTGLISYLKKLQGDALAKERRRARILDKRNSIRRKLTDNK